MHNLSMNRPRTLGSLMIFPLLHGLESHAAREGFMAELGLVRIPAVEIVSLLTCFVFCPPVSQENIR